MDCIQRWHEKYGKKLNSLELAFDHLRTSGLVDFGAARARSQAELQQQESDAVRQRAVQQSVLIKAQTEFRECKADIEATLLQLDAALGILLPGPALSLTAPATAAAAVSRVSPAEEYSALLQEIQRNQRISNTVRAVLFSFSCWT